MNGMKDAKRRLIAPEETIIREGERGTEWYLLLSGRVVVIKEGIEIDSFTESGTIFGEVSGLLNIPRTATLKATEPTELLCVAESIDQLAESHPELITKLVVTLAKRLQKTTDLMLMKFQ